MSYFSTMEKRPTTKKRKINPTVKGVITPNRDALISSEIFDKHRYKLTLNGHKLLLGLAQSIDHTHKDMFPEVGYDIFGIMRFLGVENRGDRYEVVRNAFEDIMHNPLSIRISPKKWSGVPWLAYEYDEEKSNYVNIEFHPKAVKYLLDFEKYIHIKGRDIAYFRSEYAISLYPLFKWVLEAFHGKHEMTIQRLKEYTYTDNPKEHPAYNVGSAATKDFLRRVLGVSMNQKTKKIEILPNSPILEINEKSDLVVNVIKFVKSGNRYVGVLFHVSSKKAAAKALPQNIVKQLPKGDVAHYRVPLNEIYVHLAAHNEARKKTNDKPLDIHGYCDMAGYFLKGDNFAYKKMTAKEQKEAIQIRDASIKKESKRTFETNTLSDVMAKLKNEKHILPRQLDLIEQIERETREKQ